MTPMTLECIATGMYSIDFRDSVWTMTVFTQGRLGTWELLSLDGRVCQLSQSDADSLEDC